MQTKTLAASLSFLVLIAAAALWWRFSFSEHTTSSPQSSIVPRASSLLPLVENTNEAPDIEIVAENLEIPWEIAFLPSGEALVTERPGRLLKIGANREAIPIEGVAHTGEGGLLGMALHPDFTRNNLLYLYRTYETPSGLANAVDRYRLNNTRLTERRTILDGIPGSRFHDGGRIAFGPDAKLYIATGDAGQEHLAQDTSSLAGKILRVNDDGTIPPDNPFNNAVYSYGHRNVQGMAWDASGVLWATEHGRSGIRSGYDEVNAIEKGKNYGWPEIEGDQTRQGMEPPKSHSGSSDTWAPSGAAIVKSSLLFAGLRGEALYEAKLSENSVQEIIPHLQNRFGRLRTITTGPAGRAGESENMLYMLTNNRDGRGARMEGDDKIIRINPKAIGL